MNVKFRKVIKEVEEGIDKYYFDNDEYRVEI